MLTNPELRDDDGKIQMKGWHPYGLRLFTAGTARRSPDKTVIAIASKLPSPPANPDLNGVTYPYHEGKNPWLEGIVERAQILTAPTPVMMRTEMIRLLDGEVPIEHGVVLVRTMQVDSNRFAVVAGLEQDRVYYVARGDKDKTVVTPTRNLIYPLAHPSTIVFVSPKVREVLAPGLIREHLSCKDYDPATTLVKAARWEYERRGMDFKRRDNQDFLSAASIHVGKLPGSGFSFRSWLSWG